MEKIKLHEYFRDGYVLVVDDVANMRKTIKNMFKVLGVMSVLEASDGDDAIALLRTNHENCLFIILDWNMPKMPGIQVAREIRSDKLLQDIPILMIAAEMYGEQVAQAGEIGVNGYIIKPFVAKILEDKISGILHARQSPPQHVKLIKAGETFMEEKRYNEALAIFKEAQKVKDSARVIVHVGEAYRMLGDTEMALKSFNEAAALNKEFLKAYVASANLNMELGKEEAALSSLEKANVISPMNTERQMETGQMYLKKGDENKAAKAFNIVVKLEPAKSVEIADEFMNSGHAEKAEEYLRMSIESSDDRLHIHNRLGVALKKQGKWREAVKEYEKALVENPNDEVLHFNMAKAYSQGGDSDKARECYLNAIKINAEFKEAHEELERLGKAQLKN